MKNFTVLFEKLDADQKKLLSNVKATPLWGDKAADLIERCELLVDELQDSETKIHGQLLDMVLDQNSKLIDEYEKI